MTIETYSFLFGFMTAAMFFKIALWICSLKSGCPECIDDCQQGRKCPRRMNGKD